LTCLFNLLVSDQIRVVKVSQGHVEGCLGSGVKRREGRLGLVLGLVPSLEQKICALIFIVSCVVII